MREQDTTQADEGRSPTPRRRAGGLLVGGLAVIAVAVGIAVLLTPEEVDVASGPQLSAAEMPSHDAIEECNRAAARAVQRAEAPDAGLAAEGDTTSGTLLGANAESRRTAVARTAYRHCMERRGS